MRLQIVDSVPVDGDEGNVEVGSERQAALVPAAGLQGLRWCRLTALELKAAGSEDVAARPDPLHPDVTLRAAA